MLDQYEAFWEPVILAWMATTLFWLDVLAYWECYYAPPEAEIISFQAYQKTA